MRTKLKNTSLAAAPLVWMLVLLGLACTHSPQGKNENGTTPQGEWITGAPEEQLEKTERHFRGFDMAMVETGYRYQELYWAAMDENWDYAGYQVEKLETALKNGLERRPKRAKSAEHFLEVALPRMKEAVEGRDLAVFESRFAEFTAQCNNCHAMENVPFFAVDIPETRNSPIKK